jgi:hypothetical protein
MASDPSKSDPGQSHTLWIWFYRIPSIVASDSTESETLPLMGLKIKFWESLMALWNLIPEGFQNPVKGLRLISNPTESDSEESYMYSYFAEVLRISRCRHYTVLPLILKSKIKREISLS